MKTGLVYKDRVLLFTRVELADGFWTRLRGLLGRRGLSPNTGLLLVHCRQVHTWRMKFSIDVLYLNKKMEILRIFEKVAPGRLLPSCREADFVLEINAGEAAASALRAGDTLELVRK